MWIIGSFYLFRPLKIIQISQVNPLLFKRSQATKVGSHCYTQYLHTRMNKHIWAQSQTWLPRLTSTQTHRRFELCFSQESSLTVCFPSSSCVNSAAETSWWNKKPDSLSVNPLIASPYNTLAVGVSGKAQSQMGGWWICSRGSSCTRRRGWCDPPILSGLPAAPVKDYHPRCISTTTLINPFLLLLTSRVCLTSSCTLRYCTWHYVALLVPFIGAACCLYFQENDMSPWESFLRLHFFYFGI